MDDDAHVVLNSKAHGFIDSAWNIKSFGLGSVRTHGRPPGTSLSTSIGFKMGHLSHEYYASHRTMLTNCGQFSILSTGHSSSDLAPTTGSIHHPGCAYPSLRRIGPLPWFHRFKYTFQTGSNAQDLWFYTPTASMG